MFCTSLHRWKQHKGREGTGSFQQLIFGSGQLLIPASPSQQRYVRAHHCSLPISKGWVCITQSLLLILIWFWLQSKGLSMQGPTGGNDTNSLKPHQRNTSEVGQLYPLPGTAHGMSRAHPVFTTSQHPGVRNSPREAVSNENASSQERSLHYLVQAPGHSRPHLSEVKSLRNDGSVRKRCA